MHKQLWPVAALLWCGLSAPAAVTVTRSGDRIDVSIDHTPEMSFFFGQPVTKPYVYPLLTAEGIRVTRGWPMDPHSGERHDHMHQRGLWFAHSSVNGIDFWNSDPSYHNARMGTILVEKINALKSEQSFGLIDVSLGWYAPQHKLLLDESRVMTFHSGDPRVIDVDITLTAREHLVFGDDKDGVFGIRLASELEEPAHDAPNSPARTGTMTNSEGCSQEAGCWGKRAAWLDVSGTFDGKQAGVAVFDDASNPRSPTYWHARGYGLLAANIFGVKAFTRDDKADGSLTLEKGASLRFRYRVVLHSGDAKTAHIPDLYRSYQSSAVR